jgi:hypothetical protein
MSIGTIVDDDVLDLSMRVTMAEDGEGWLHYTSLHRIAEPLLPKLTT